jgi:hypothetical protein
MNLCSKIHDEVCYEGRRCPACDVIDERNDVIAGLRHQLERMEERNARAEEGL